jgi:sugar/nucleoside kinase (ribokinase family)
MEICESLSKRRHSIDPKADAPVLIWEPIPDLCTPEQFLNLRKAALGVTIVSPNRGEFAAFFKESGLSMQEMVKRVIQHDGDERRSSPAFVIRDGAQGCHVFNDGARLHLRAYHQNNVGVIDPTGGGNTFLGGLAMALSGKGDPRLEDLPGLMSIGSPAMKTMVTLLFAALHATVAASFAIEQVGLPIVDLANPDIWNGQSYRRRLVECLKREAAYLSEQFKGLDGTQISNCRDGVGLILNSAMLMNLTSE